MRRIFKYFWTVLELLELVYEVTFWICLESVFEFIITSWTQSNLETQIVFVVSFPTLLNFSLVKKLEGQLPARTRSRRAWDQARALPFAFTLICVFLCVELCVEIYVSILLEDDEKFEKTSSWKASWRCSWRTLKTL